MSEEPGPDEAAEPPVVRGWDEFAPLYDEHHERLYRVALLLCHGSEAMAEDAVAETFLRVYPAWAEGRIDHFFAAARQTLVTHVMGQHHSDQVATRYAECATVLHDGARFTSNPGHTAGVRAEAGVEVPFAVLPAAIADREGAGAEEQALTAPRCVGAERHAHLQLRDQPDLVGFEQPGHGVRDELHAQAAARRNHCPVLASDAA